MCNALEDSAEQGVHWRTQIMENKAMRKLAKVRSEEILLIEHRRAHNICIELAGVRMPFNAIKVRMPFTAIRMRRPFTPRHPERGS